MNLRDTLSREWYALYTKSYFERKVNDILSKKKITTFLPLRRGKARIADSYRFTKVPLFRSYLFINISLNSQEYYNVLDTTGVSYIVKKGNRPCSVSSEIIESLQNLVEKMSSEVSVITQIKRGERVRIIKGPLRGTIGEMLKVDNRRYKFVVNVGILGRSVEVLIPPEYVISI